MLRKYLTAAYRCTGEKGKCIGRNMMERLTEIAWGKVVQIDLQKAKYNYGHDL